MPKTDGEANARKAEIDSLAAGLLNLDQDKLETEGGKIAFDLTGPEEVRLCVTGAAGSGKSTLARVIGERLNLPVFDFDEYVPGGYHKDGPVYRKRLLEGMNHLFDDLPVRKGWVLEHVESCNDDMVKAFRPTHCLLLSPQVSRLLSAAQARGHLSGDDEAGVKEREQRSLESAEYARMQFEKVPGEIMRRGKGWLLKKTSSL